MGYFLYDLLIAPLEFIIGIVAWRLYRIFYDTGTVLIGLSLFVMLVTQPMYRAAERIKADAESKQRGMRQWEKHIRTVFKGDERMMMLSALYRKYGYKQSSIIWNIAPLLLQIPFFMAAYNFLSDSELLKGRSFMDIANLASSDRLIHICGYSFNLLPILMTVINIISALIYHKDSDWKDRMQPLLLAAVFLLLLYNSPSGLVLYWLMNNVFSLIRNIIDRYVKNRGLLLFALACMPLAWYWFYVIYGMGKRGIPFADGGAFLIFLLFPAICVLSRIRKNNISCPAKSDSEVNGTVTLLIHSALAGLFGGVIPLSLMVASPEDFVSIYQYYDPLKYVINAFILYSGLFIIWGSLISIMVKKEKRMLYARLMLVVLFASLINFLFFGGIYGEFNNELIYTGINSTVMDILINAGIILVTVLFGMFIFRKPKVIKVVSISVLLAIFIYIISSAVIIEKTLKPTEELAEKTGDTIESSYIEPEIELSKNEKNVIVIMLDRAIGAYFPYILEDRSDLKEKLAGVTYYPDTLSYGKCTVFGSPALFGGYEYTPAAINERSDKKLVDKHNEALKLMPILFGESGYQVTVADLPFANYHNVTDLSIYDEYAYVKQCHLEGKYVDKWMLPNRDTKRRQLRFKYFSLVRISPLLWSEELFVDAWYASGGENLSTSPKFLYAYNVLDNLDRLTSITEDNNKAFILMNNNTVHEPRDLQLPDYTPDLTIDNRGYSFAHSPMHTDKKDDIEQYLVFASAILRLGEYFDYLREQGVYDNTRIIVVADHGYPRAQFDDMVMFGGALDVEGFNPLLLVKDFNSTELTVSDEFMTNADVPTLAMAGLIEDPVNPFTGNKVNSDAKAEVQYVTNSWNFNPIDGTVFDTSDAHWYAVHDSIFKEENWSVWK